MGLFDGCLLVSDIDGTLEYRKKICDRNISAIRRFAEAGGSFAVATGRHFNGSFETVKALPAISPSIVCNGTIIYDFNERRIISAKVIDRSEHLLVKLVLERFAEVGVGVYCGSDVFVLRKNKFTVDTADFEQLEMIENSFEAVDKLDWNGVMLCMPDHSVSEKILELASGLELSSQVIDCSAIYNGETRYYVDQTPPGVSKGEAVGRLRSYLNVKPGGLFAIGDYYNDFDMIKAADIGALTANAPEDLKARAEIVVGTVENGAVADFIDYLFEHRKET